MADRVGQQFGNYHLLREIGRGAFAAVYLGEHLYLERPAAIKVLHVQMEPKTQEAFRREARTIARLQHPHIVQVYDFGIVEQTPYLVMEYTPGGTLRERYPKGTCLTYEQIITYVKQIASALDYAHQQRVIHRDIKPANLLLNAKGEVVLSDFGIAVVQRTLESLSEQNMAGTPLYMAPEQIQHQSCAASDQYALGVMVYEWLCGEPPFLGPGMAIFGQHLHQSPPSLCTRLSHLPPAVEDAVFGALAKDPVQRFASVQDFATVLEEACFGTQPLVLQMLQEQESTASLVQPGPISSQRGESQYDPGRSLTLGPATQNQLVSQQTKVSVAKRNRQALLRKVQSFWIEGVLSHSLHGAALLTLGLETLPDAVANPWHLVLQHPDALPYPLPTGTRITQVYDDAEGELLILGAPGAGKTTLLLELACDLLARAQADEQYPMPVVFNLSSWAMKQQTLVDWLVEELNTKYQVPSKLAQALLSADQILPLLDGLDEVAPAARTACIEAINTYRREHGLFPLVVCSRQADYLAQSGRLLLRSAVTVQSLTQEQVDVYLAQGGEPLWALRVALHQDATLRELTSTPLMLSILTLTYHGQPVEELLRGTSMEERQQQIFEQYVKRMLTRRGPLKAGTAQQVVQWLTYLAAQMRKHNQTVFYLEQMQSSWLTKGRFFQCLKYALVRLGVGLAFGLIIGLTYGLTTGIPTWLVPGLALLLRPDALDKGTYMYVLTHVGYSYTLTGEPIVRGPFGNMLSALAGGIEAGLIVGFVTGLIALRNTGIRPAAKITWSWRNVQRRWRIGLFVGLITTGILGLILYVLDVLFGTKIDLLIPLLQSIPVGLGCGLATTFVSGLSSSILEKRHSVRPNQGIWNSARNSWLIGFLVGPTSGLIIGLLSLLVGVDWSSLLGQDHNFDLGLALVLISQFFSFAPIISSIIWSIYGGGACIKHVALRLLLRHAGVVPRHYVRFLDEAASCILLQKVGGGYSFVHRLLLDYFAALEKKDP